LGSTQAAASKGAAFTYDDADLELAHLDANGYCTAP
jgi:hypothetical protein